MPSPGLLPLSLSLSRSLARLLARSLALARSFSRSRARSPPLTFPLSLTLALRHDYRYRSVSSVQSVRNLDSRLNQSLSPHPNILFLGSECTIETALPTNGTNGPNVTCSDAVPPRCSAQLNQVTALTKPLHCDGTRCRNLSAVLKPASHHTN